MHFNIFLYGGNDYTKTNVNNFEKEKYVNQVDSFLSKLFKI